MEKNNNKSIVIAVIITILVMVILIMGYFMYQMYTEKNANNNRIDELNNKISNLENSITNTNENINETNINTSEDNNIEIVASVLNGNDDNFPDIYIDKNGYAYYDANYLLNNDTKEYRPIIDQNNNKIKPSVVVLQFPSERNEIDPTIQEIYTFITNDKVYQLNYYYNKEKKGLDDYAQVKYENEISKYKFIEVKDQYGGHTIDMTLTTNTNENYTLVDIQVAYDVNTNEDLIFDSWHMDFSKEYTL